MSTNSESTEDDDRPGRKKRLERPLTADEAEILGTR